MRSRDADAPHFSVPFRLDPSGSYVEVEEQDSQEELRGCAQVVLATPLGHFPHDPKFGIHDPAHRDASEGFADLTEAVERAEPRITAETEELGIIEDAARRVRVGATGG